VFLAGTGTAIPFLFLRITHDLPCGSGDERRAAERPFVLISVPVLPHLRGFARPRYQPDRATFVVLRLRSVVTIDVHGFEDRVKDVSPMRDHTAVKAMGALA
jgi:hypothetical protein